MAQLRYMYTMPVERIVKYFKDNGFELPMSTAHNLLKKAAVLLDNLYNTMRMAVLSDKYMGCDETYAKSSLKNPVRTVYMSKKVMSGWR